MSTFDPDTFLDNAVGSELSTEFIPVPEGEYNAVIDDVSVKVTNSGYTILNVRWNIDDPAVAEVTGRNNNSVVQSIFLDITSDGQLDTAKGKNIGLGRLRDIFDQNDSSHTLRQLIGGCARILVAHRHSDDGQVFTDVKSVTAI